MAAQVPRLTAPFLDGPKQGETIVVDDPPPKYLKLGMPEWVVYEYSGPEKGYKVLLDGLAARAWRSPRTEFT